MELNKENLYNEYIVNDKTIAECAIVFNVSNYKITKTLSKYHIRKYENKESFFDKVQGKITKYLGVDYILVSRDFTRKDCVLVKHIDCGNEFEIGIRWLKESQGCQLCKKAAKEKEMLSIIQKYYIGENLSIERTAKKTGTSKYNLGKIVDKYHLRKTVEKEKQAKSTALKKAFEDNKAIKFDKQEIITLLKEGFLRREIANAYDCSQSAVTSYILKNHLDKYTNKQSIIKRKTEKTKKTCLLKYGVVTPLMREDVRVKVSENRISISNPELELKKYVENVYGKPVTRFHDSSLELDIYIPEKKLGIEYNGNYWHSLKNKDKNYHYNKSKHFEEKGIRVIHIWEYEWNNERQRPILENIIKNALGLNMEKVYARKCSIEVRPSASMKDFFNENNIQGFRGGKFAICLVYNNEVIMAYMMGHCYFGKGKYQWEVIRGATKLGYTVVGGASKIWKYFIENYNPTNCVYYIDYNYFNGNSLPYLGLTYLKSQPGFKNWWVKTNTVKNREPQRHKEIKELYEKGEVVPIYNAGTKVYVWENHSIKLGNNTD